MAEKKTAGGKIEIVLGSSELIEYCQAETSALIAKMGEFNALKKQPK